MEELYYYMRKNDDQTNSALIEFGARLRRKVIGQGYHL